MQHLAGTVQTYEWGSTTAIPELLGVEAHGGPQAELWLGAHPVAPAMLADGRRLDEAIAAAAPSVLGPGVISRFGPSLPFLLKVLAAEAPLSIQAHPDVDQARAGFAREEAAGIPLGAPERLYKDPNHKPELIVALTPFEALCGFRPADEIADELEAIGIRSWSGRLRRDGLASTVAGLFGSTDAAKVSIVRRVAEAHPFVAELAQRYPDDIGCVVALFLRRITLQPGEGLELAAGNLHAYLRGVGVELMANSDNVLRGGLTVKHVDAEELLRVVHVDDAPVPVLQAESTGTGWRRYPTVAAEFTLSVADVHGSGPTVRGGAPSVLLCTAGSLRVGDLELRQGQSAFVAACDADASVTGEGTLWWATVPA
jgi:mannose-6-phosphate isomerase